MRHLIIMTAVAAVFYTVPAAAFVTLDRDTTAWQRNPSYQILNSSPDIGDGSDAVAIRAAFRSWQNVAGSSISFTEVRSAGDITVGFSNPWPRDVGSSAAGVTYTRRSRGVISSAEILLNNQHFQWSTSVDNNGEQADVEGVTVHEVGHAIGLDHSFERLAVMYWSGVGLDLRALHADDARGAVYLYGNGAGRGLLCDTCETNADCARGGICLGLEQGAAFCGIPCGNGCPENTACYGLQNSDDTQCAPTAQFCSDDGGSTIAEGEYCWGATQCAGNLQCVPLPGGPALCTRECTRTDQCQDGAQCLGGLCLPGGDGEFGDACESNLDCASLLCLPFDDDVAACSAECNPLRPACPGGASCVAIEDAEIDGLCVPPGTVREGGRCDGAATRCVAELTCIFEDDNGGSCRAMCEPFGDCAANRGCTPFGNDNWFCLPTDGADEGDACDPNAPGCDGGLLCLPVDEDDNGICFRVCDDRLADGCGADRGCFDVDGDEGNLGICSIGDAGFGDECESGFDCASFICVANGNAGICTRSCAEEACPNDGSWMCSRTNGGDQICFPDDGANNGGNNGANNGANNGGGNNGGGNNGANNGGGNNGANNGANNGGNNGAGSNNGGGVGNNGAGGGFTSSGGSAPGGCQTAPHGGGGFVGLLAFLGLLLTLTWRMRRTVPALAVVAVLAVPTVAAATTVRPMGLTELVEASDLVVNARVIDQRSYVEGPKQWIYTETRIEIVEAWKGKAAPGSFVTVRQLGGTVGEEEMIVHGTPTLRVGSEVVLFLDADEQAPRHYVVGLAQGHYEVDRSGPVAVVGRDLTELKSMNGAALEPAPATKPSLTLETLRTRVKAAAR